MEIYSIGFTQRSAEAFFGSLAATGIRRLLDVRLHNTSQLAGFAKRGDLSYFLRELCGAAYEHEPLLAPTAEILDAYRSGDLTWSGYETAYLDLLRTRQAELRLDRNHFTTPTALLCSERTAEHCHRRLAMQYLQNAWGDLTLHHL